MYSEFYNFSELPFQITPDHRFFFAGGPHRKALAYATYGLSKGEGFLIITGDVGAGKTTLIEYLISQLEPGSRMIARVVTTQMEADSLLRLVAANFGLQHEGLDKAALLKLVENSFIDLRQNAQAALLIIDEVQNLTRSALEELRMLSNFQYGSLPLLQVFLVGQVEFRNVLNDPTMDQLRQRVIANYHLRPLNVVETKDYIEHRLRHVGWVSDPAIDSDAYGAIHNATGGVPRRINVLCDRLLLSGYLSEKHQIDCEDVAEVVGEMKEEQLIGATAISEDERASNVLDIGTTRPGARGSADLDRLSRRVGELESQLSEQETRLRQTLDRVGAWFGKTK